MTKPAACGSGAAVMELGPNSGPPVANELNAVPLASNWAREFGFRFSRLGRAA
ncbi:MAG: hypothetical protein WA771_11150 [Chthoniobacterales bacterium]